MEGVKTTEDKTALLKERLEQQRALGAQIDRALARADGETAGCGVCEIWRRITSGRRRAVLAAGGGDRAVHTVASGATATQARLFGMKKVDANAKLAEAAATMERRIQELELRAASQRAEAKRQLQAGQRSSAIRMLKKAKATEKQLEANQASMLALEQQVDLMAQAQMQKQIASALASSSKGMKAQKKLLKNAEAAVDDAQDARDLADDLGNVMAEFATSGNGNMDNDDLLAELEEMVSSEAVDNDSAPESTEQSTAADATAARAAEISKLESRLARYDESVAKREAVRQMPAAPSGELGVGKVGIKLQEKEQLLGNDPGV